MNSYSTWSYFDIWIFLHKLFLTLISFDSFVLGENSLIDETKGF